MGKQRTFGVYWKVNFDDFSIEAENGLKMGFDYTPGEVGDDDDFCVWFVVCAVFHVDVGIVKRVRRSRPASGGHCGCR